MEIQYKIEDNVLSFSLSDHLNEENVKQAEKALTEIWDGNDFNSVVIDCLGMESISADGLRVLLKLYRKKKRISLIHVHEDIYRAFFSTGYTDILDIQEIRDQPAVSEDDKLNDTAWPASFTPVSKLFEKQAEAHPDRLAVATSRMSMTYEELNEEANRAANILRYHSVGPEDIVMILLPRSIMAYVANLAVLKAGAAFLPVSTGYPDDRIDYIYKDAGCCQLITTHRIAFERLDLILKLGYRPLFLEDLITSPWTETPLAKIDQHNLAYCIYTSGSTGNPKGVMIEQENLQNFLDHNPKNVETMGIAENSEVFLAIAPLTFDVSIMEEFIPLTSGHTVILASEEEIMNPLLLGDLMDEYHVDGMFSTPSYMTTLLSIPQLHEALARIKVFDFGAESFSGTLYEALRKVNPDAIIQNGYGPTEATISCTMKLMKSAENITIGKPNANVFCYIIDENNEEVKKGEIGELLICGKGVGRGYKNLPDKTAESFIKFRGMRGYKSGDLARINECDEIEFHGRRDNQVKYHGLRIELEEIEKNMASCPNIRECTAMVYEGQFLCLYYVPAEETSQNELREYAKKHLAHYMIPDIFVPIDEIPMTPNLKIDKKRLPAPELPHSEYVEPSTPIQEKILEIVKRVNSEYPIGVTSSFLDMGFSSLDFMMLLANLSDEFSVGLTLGEIREHPTVVELEEVINSKSHTGKAAELKEQYPATSVQAVLYSNMIENNTVDNVVPFMLELDKSVDIERLKNAVRKAADNHPALFARFAKDENGTIVIRPCMNEHPSYEIPVIEMTPAEMPPLMDELALTLVEPDAYPLFNVRIYKTEEKTYLYIAAAHAIFDGASIDVLTEDIAAAYNGDKLKKEAMTIFEYNEELEQYKKSPLFARTLGYYKNLLDGLDRWPQIPMNQTSIPARTDTVSVPVGIDAEHIASYMDRLNISGNIFFAGILALALAVESGSNDIPFMFVYNGRNNSRLRRTVGCTVGQGMVRLKIIPNGTIGSLYQTLQKQTFDAMSCEELPLAEMLEMQPKLMSYQYLFQEDSPDQIMDGKAAKTISLDPPIERQSAGDEDASSEQQIYEVVTQVFWKDTVSIQLSYQANKYSGEQIRKMADNMDRMLKRAVAAGDGDITLKTLMDECR